MAVKRKKWNGSVMYLEIRVCCQEQDRESEEHIGFELLLLSVSEMEEMVVVEKIRSDINLGSK